MLIEVLFEKPERQHHYALVSSDLFIRQARVRCTASGPEWEIVREDREPPQERFGRGLEVASLRAIVGSLEAL